MPNLLDGFPAPPLSSEWSFVTDLQSHAPRVFPPVQSLQAQGVANLKRGVVIDRFFSDPGGVLNTAYDSLTRLMAENGIHSGPYIIQTILDKRYAKEEYRLFIQKERTGISAADAEGIRRGIFALEEFILANGTGCIPCCTISRKPWLDLRISRCFFSPVKRWPVNTDELLDDFNYYPDEYLDKLAHEAINAIWIVVSLQELASSSFTAADPKAEQRIAKLNRTVRQCARYGIKVFVFCIEPFALPCDYPLATAHPELFGASAYGKRLFCPSSQQTQQYLRELTCDLFSKVPNLGGIINISHGERPTTCVSALSGSTPEPIPCPECAKIGAGKAIGLTLNAMNEGMKAANPDAQLIAWFYFPHTEQHAEWNNAIGAFMPKGVTAQFNFESGGEKTQLGRVHAGGDYWLSYAGPSERFKLQAHNTRSAACLLSAKLQVGCSYELALVPFIPAPGILWDKFLAMKSLGVSKAMFCWYVGNYPGAMNMAAGKLAFTNLASDAASKYDFLCELAAPMWGKASHDMANVWKILSSAYENLPFSLMFQYYGPQNTGSVSRLSAFPILKPLSPPWKPIFPPPGDAIGEALADFSIDEALQLMQTICYEWQQAHSILEPWKTIFADNHERMLDIMLFDALHLIFENSCNILRFYQLRSMLFADKSTKRKACLNEMRDIAVAEAKISTAMIALCRKDTRLGFHSEALCHRFYPELLAQRASDTATRIPQELDELEAAMDNGVSPWDAYMERPGHPDSFALDTEYKLGQAAWSACATSDSLTFSFILPNDFKGGISVYFCDTMGVSFPTIVSYAVDGNDVAVASESHLHVIGRASPLASPYCASFNNGILKLDYPFEHLSLTDNRLRINIAIHSNGKADWASGQPYEPRLYLGAFSPEQTAILTINQ